MADQEESTASVIVALLANAAIAVAKFIGAFMSGSASMLAEGFHSLTDTGNEALLLVGIKKAEKPADSDHPFGYGKERYFWSFVVATSLFVIGGALSVLEGIKKLMGGQESNGGIVVPLIILAVAAVFESISFTVAIRNLSSRREGRGLLRTFIEIKDPTIITVVCEDTAALTGLAIAAAGILLAHFTGHEVFDAIGSIMIGLLLGGVAAYLGRESKSMLIGESALPLDRRHIEQICRANPNIVAIEELLTMHVTPDNILVNLNLHFEAGLKTNEIKQIIVDLEKQIHQEVPEVQQVFIEPV